MPVRMAIIKKSTNNKFWIGCGDGEGTGDPLPVLLPGKSHGWRSLVGCSPWGREESEMTEQLSTAQHGSSILVF